MVCGIVAVLTGVAWAQANQQAEAAHKRGEAASDNKNYKKAISEFTEAIRLNPNEPKYLKDRGFVYDLYIEDYDKAIADYTKAIQLEPDDDDAYYWRGEAYIKKGDHDKAIADYTKRIQMNPNKPEFLKDRGFVYYLFIKDYDKAIEDFTEAIRLKPDYDYAYQLRGESYEKKGDHDKAIADYTEMLRIKPGSYKFLLERALKKCGDNCSSSYSDNQPTASAPEQTTQQPQQVTHQPAPQQTQTPAFLTCPVCKNYMPKCNICDGTGRLSGGILLCSVCKGTGTTCGAMHSQQQAKPAPQQNNRQQQATPNRPSTTQFGSTPATPAKTPQMCMRCHGNGKCQYSGFNLSSCNGGRVDCDMCNGRGVDSRDNKKVCSKCRGAKKMPCPHCRGSGKCQACNGKGKV